MRIIRFTAVGIHGFLNYDLAFDQQLTFVTGINGSGKTTVLTAIVSLISPSLPMLANLSFDHIEVDVEHEKRSLTITARQSEGQISLSVSSSSASLLFNKFAPDPDSPSPKHSDSEAEYYRDFALRHAQHEVLQEIARLPTPMFLGLDRRARFSDDSPWLRYPIRPLRSRSAAGPTSLSVRDAIALAETTYRDTLIAAGRMGEQQRRDMLLQLLSMRTMGGFPTISPPTSDDLKLLRSLKKDVASLPEILGLSRAEVEGGISPFLEQMQQAVEGIPRDVELDKLFSRHNDTEAQARINSLMFWSVNKAGLIRLQALAELVGQYNKRKQDLIRRSEEYLSSVNTFLGDSGKTVAFDENGYISFTVRGAPGSRELFTLSSGEAQLFVILTHLFFHPQAQSANVFIIDEPELSLHVQWQEMLVSQMEAASPAIQFILATHSPSIILDRINNCVDLSPRQGGRA